uniref:Uncharacterized protein n=1 Tax=Candidatus Kentrum sp. FW TaxID=2126338 RepID=A0A450SWG2_9GAMM|nr:MAG: hypothetical protein BECKFW1821B_GA0114236_104017 [Candidatus Kentron sp. FW]
MLRLHKNYIIDENQKAVAVQIPIMEFKQIEELLENHGLAELMDETRTDERLSGEAAQQYYRSLKNNVEG